MADSSPTPPNKEKLSNSRADSSIKALAHQDWLANDLTTAEIVAKYNANNETVLRWLKEWSSERIAEISKAKYSLTLVTPESVKIHEESTVLAAREAQRVGEHLAKLVVGTPEHAKQVELWLKLQKRVSELTGIDNKLHGDRVRESERAKAEIAANRIKTNGLAQEPMRIAGSGPVVPLDE